MSLSYQCEIDGLVMLTLSGVVVMRDICYRPSVRLSVRLSVCLSVTRVDHTKTVEVRIMKLSPCGSPIPLVF